MIIRKDRHSTKYLMDAMRQSLGHGAREGIHISDLLAPMRCFWAHTEPRLPTDDEVLYFTAGKGHEGVLLGLLKADHTEDKLWEDILWYSPDITLWGKPGEVKTRRRKVKDDAREDVATYLEQVLSYCVCEKTNEAFIIILYLQARNDDFTTKPELHVYYVQFDDEDLERKKLDMVATYRRLDYAIQSGDRSELPWCEDWKCGRIVRVKIKEGRCLSCGKQLQARSINKHLRDSKGKCTGAEAPLYYEYVVPKCRWWDVCSPPISRRLSDKDQDGNELRPETSDSDPGEFTGTYSEALGKGYFDQRRYNGDKEEPPDLD